MKKFIAMLIIVLLIAGAYILVQARSNPCRRVLSYSVGAIDPRFGISSEDFARDLQEIERVWEDPMGRELFQYDPSAGFKVNLVFDDRQQKTIDERNERLQIDLTEQSYEKLVEQYNNFSFQHKEGVTKFNAEKANYEERLKTYNDEVDYWNKRGGAPAADFKRLSAEKTALANILAGLDVQRQTINSEVSTLNALGERINVVAKDLNKDVDDYNGKFGEPRQFDQGTYTGNAINIYQFNEESDLRLVIAHELGHALGLDHISDPKAIMYYLMDKQDLAIIELSEGDLKAIKDRCGA